MLANALVSLGEDVNFLGGGRVLGLGKNGSDTNYRTGDSDTLVFEADESDGSIVSYRPEHTVLLNLDLDHNPVEETAQMFRTLMENTCGLCLLNADDLHLNALIPKSAVTFSMDSPSSHSARQVALGAFGSEFMLHDTRFTLTLPGRHNVYNALACASVLIELGHSPGEAAQALASFRGISRRFNIHLNDRRGLVIDDYAHNPHKLTFLMETVRRAVAEPVCYIFQPHGFGPTRLMKEGYIQAFSDGLREQDMLVLLPIFYSGGTAAQDISSKDLAREIRNNGGNVHTVYQRNGLLEIAHKYRSFVILGARDESLTGLARDISSELVKGSSG
jgi:UDP-N-acetylmuramate--alanine ligase